MRIGAHFAVFAILNYTKIIDNSLYSSYLFNHLWLGIQWGAAPWVTSYTAQAIFPISFSNTRKILGAFYVDQKKKDLPPSTLPSEHKQWISNCHFNITNRWPVSFKNIYVAIANIKGYTSDKTIYTNKVDASNTTVTINATRNNNFEDDIYGFCLGVGKV